MANLRNSSSLLSLQTFSHYASQREDEIRSAAEGVQKSSWCVARTAEMSQQIRLPQVIFGRAFFGQIEGEQSWEKWYDEMLLKNK